ncbi:MAG TPA: peptidylprolyl isomerase, partial [Holophaga sp.]|nr:peptidylprolyl isomerase [Holophaga sp.]
EQESAALYRQYSGRELDDQLRDARERTLKGLVDSFLLQDKATDMGAQVSDEQLAAIVEGIKRENNFQSDADFAQALRTSFGISMEEYLKRTRQQVIQQELLRRQVYSQIAIEEQELKAYYEEHKDEYRLPSRFHIRELVLPKGATPEAQQATQAKLQEIQGALKAGKPFEEVAKAYSASPTRDMGGDLGWLNKGLLVPSVEEAALSLSEGQVSAPVETDKDVYLVQLLAVDEDVVRPFAEVKGKILEKLQEPKAQNAIERYLDELRMRANIRYMVPRDQLLKG